MDRRQRLRDARLYFVADRGGMEHALEGALAGGVDLFQLRDKDASDDELLAAARSRASAATPPARSSCSTTAPTSRPPAGPTACTSARTI